MLNLFSQKNHKENKLYNTILALSRNKLFYTKLGLTDTFQNRINLIFIHISFLFIKLKQNKNPSYKKFYQKIFDSTFRNIELNIREIGYGDVTVNKKMKILVRTFYNILFNCEKYRNKKFMGKKLFLLNYLSKNDEKSTDKDHDLVKYFNKYEAFCLDLSQDSVLSGDLNFNY